MSAQKPKGKETNVQRIIVRHTKGSKAGQLEEFPINMYDELNIGRDASSTIKFDPETDDLVSRHHAKIVKDKIDPTQFSIMDVGSANGTYVNKQKIFSQTRVQPGDRIQLGPGGPEFEFDLAPRPTEVKKTRLATGQGTQSPTRTFEGSVVTTGTKPGYKTTFGKNTVMQMMAKARGESRKLIGAGVGILAVIIALTVFYFVKTDKSQELEVKIIGVERRVGEAEKNKPMTGAQIARKYEKAVVYLRVSWHLIHTPSRQKVYQLYLP
ncbi:MAG: FHA domain-containing protein, partial [Thermodesulfobacteriota bacterium]